MRIRLNSWLMGSAFLAMAVCLSMEGVEAFCVYNHADFDIEAVQVAGYKGRPFSIKIPTKGNACCNWGTADCNTGGKRDSNVAITITGFCERVSIKAGGWIKFWADRPGVYRCETGFDR